MRPFLLLALMLVLALPVSSQQQPTPETLVQAAQAQGASLNALIQGAGAARSLRNFTEAEALFDRAKTSLAAQRNGLLNNLILYELASGGGVNGAQRAFREARSLFVMQPQEIGTWINTYPELLVGGELDDVISRLSPDAADPRYRCNCYAQRGWMYRIAGDMERSRMLFDSVAMAADRNVPANETPAARAQLVRNFARAGKPADAQRVMQRALAVDRIDQLPSAAQYNWAQAYAELRDIPRMIEILDRLIMRGDLVTVQLLEARVSWDIVRQEPTFQQLLARHRGVM
jgi:tetratricopeptide (TPR) repeat protein